MLVKSYVSQLFKPLTDTRQHAVLSSSSCKRKHDTLTCCTQGTGHSTTADFVRVDTLTCCTQGTGHSTTVDFVRVNLRYELQKLKPAVTSSYPAHTWLGNEAEKDLLAVSGMALASVSRHIYTPLLLL